MVITRFGTLSPLPSIPADNTPPSGTAASLLRSELTLADPPPVDLSWSTTWTELPRAYVTSTTSTWLTGERAAFAVVMGASTLVSGVAMAAPQDTSGTEAIARDVLFNAPTLGLTKNVGVGQTNNAADVTALQTALKSKGFDVGVDGKWGKGTEKALRVYEAMLTGEETVANTSGKVIPGRQIDRTLASADGPRWTRMPDSGNGFVNLDTDGYSYGSSLSVDTLSRSADRYMTNYRASHPGASIIGLNDVSTKAGGHNSDHASHQAGLDIDIKLPTTGGSHGTVVGQASYDREATYAMIKAFAVDPQVERILITDPVLLNRISGSDFAWKGKVKDGGAQHRNHMHVDVGPFKAPAAQ